MIPISDRFFLRGYISISLSDRALTEGPAVASVVFRRQGVTCISEFELSDSVRQAIKVISMAGWEEETPRLHKDLYILRNTVTEAVTAAGMYLPGTSFKFKGRPDLVWFSADSGRVRKRCYY